MVLLYSINVDVSKKHMVSSSSRSIGPRSDITFLGKLCLENLIPKVGNYPSTGLIIAEVLNI
jgi:hypothetical protein